MIRTLTATEAKAKFLALLDDVEAGEEIEITRRGVTIASIIPRRGSQGLKNLFKGIVTSDASDDELIYADMGWELQ